MPKTARLVALALLLVSGATTVAAAAHSPEPTRTVQAMPCMAC